MVVWHVCSMKKLMLYRKTGFIMAPVRTWESPERAAQFSLSTGRRVILRLKFPDHAPKLAGHGNEAHVLNEDYRLTKDFLVASQSRN